MKSGKGVNKTKKTPQSQNLVENGSSEIPPQKHDHSPAIWTLSEKGNVYLSPINPSFATT